MRVSSELRSRAERKLDAIPRASSAASLQVASADAQRLVHELQVHQIELELQNEELKQAKTDAEISLEQYTDLYDFAPVGYLSLDEKGQIREVNLTGATLLGVERSRLVGRRFQLFVSIASHPGFQAFFDRVFSGREKQTYEASLLKTDGLVFWAELQARAVAVPEGAPRWCRVTVSDISARKKAEEALRDKQWRLRYASESARLTYVELDFVAGEARTAENFPEVMGYTPPLRQRTDVAASKTLLLRHVVADDRPRVQAALDAFLAGQRIGKIDYRLLGDDGIERWIETRWSVKLGPDDKPLTTFATSLDITERKQAEAAQLESEARYRTLFDSIDEAFCVIELIYDRRKNPVDFRFLEVNPTFAKHTGLIDATGRRMRELVPKLETHWFTIFGRVAHTGEPMRFVHEAKAMGARWFDAYACRFGGPGSHKVAVVLNDISERRQAEEMLRQSHLALQSHAEELGRFNRVAVGRDLRMLDLKKEINELCLRHGEPPRYALDLESNEEPVVHASFMSAAPSPPPELEPLAEFPRLVLAEDDVVVREYLLKILRPHYRVEALDDGQAALECALAHPPDIILTDVMMPHLDGLGLLRRLRADERTRDIPILMLSGLSSEAARSEGLGTGADDYLIKPFSAQELLLRLRSQLELARLRRENERHHHEKNAELARRVAELQRANAETQDARRAALNVMEDALESRRTAEALTVQVRESEARYRTLFTSIDEGYCVIEMITSPRGRPLDYRFLEVNPAFERQSGLIDVRGKRILELVPDIEYHWIQIYARVARSGEPLRFIAHVPAMGDRWFDIYACPVGGPGTAKIALIFNDITERRKVEERMRVSEVRYRRLFEAALDGVLLLDPVTRKITDANPYMTKLLGYPYEELVGKELFEIGLLKDEGASQAMVRKLKRKGRVRYEDLPLKTTAGRHQDVKVVANLYQEDGRTVIQCNIRDITERKRAEETQRGLVVMTASNTKLKEEIVRRRAVEAALTSSERRARLLLEQARELQAKLRDLSRRMMGVEEELRKKISRELHDDISQLLVGIIVHLSNVTKSAKLDPESLLKTITPLHQMVQESVRVVHRFARELRPSMLDDLGLVPALEAYIHDFPATRGLRVEFTAFAGADPLDTEKRTMLYRVAQEALTNAAKHARASVVRVSLTKTRSRVRLEVRDDGRAFDVGLIASPEWRDHLGLVGMRERVEMVGGRFEIVSEAGVGTTVQAEVPTLMRGSRGRPEAE